MVKGKHFQSTGEILSRLLKGRGWGKKIGQYSFLEHWPAIVGPVIARQTTPHLWQGDTLTVKVTHSAWMQELKMMEPQLLAKIRAQAPDLKIQKIRWTL